MANLRLVVPRRARGFVGMENENVLELIADDVEEDLLIEEISIDGMCGVY